MTAEQKIEWLNERDPFNEWALNDDVFCLHCDGAFKAQDIADDGTDEPTCPVCRSSGPVDFGKLPWWRKDLTVEGDAGCKWKWRERPIVATAGYPGRLHCEKCMVCGIPVRECGCYVE